MVALNEARRLLSGRVHSELDDETETHAPSLGARAADLDVTVEAHEALEQIAALSEQQVRIFSLHLAGLTYEEICAATGYSRRQVDRHIVRARRRLRERCSEDKRAGRGPGNGG
jgi:DNA-directed RNA polymerase specialized sigma24 family protein